MLTNANDLIKKEKKKYRWPNVTQKILKERIKGSFCESFLLVQYPFKTTDHLH